MNSLFLMEISNYLSRSIELLSAIFVFTVGLFILIAAILYIKDRSQKESTILRNYPLIGRFRFIFEKIGEFFRQYFFAMDREELPFNRAERSWVYRAAKDMDTTIAFGSTRDLRPTGTILFVNCPFPVLGQDSTPIKDITIGPDCKTPYTTNSLFNISAMSYGAISRPAVQALSKGARLAGCWLNTGEGRLSPYHL